MKRKLICAALALSTLLSGIPTFAASSIAFTDVSKTAWYADAVDYAVANDMFSGTEAAKFSPKSPMTRAMFVTVLGRMNGVDKSTTSDNKRFADVDFAKWYGPGVVWASENGIVSGTSDASFSPDKAITREQIAVILYRYLSKLDMTMPDTGNKAFNDAASVSAFAKEAVSAMQRWGFVTGDDKGCFNPQAKVTRAEAAAMLMRVDYCLENGTPYTTADDDAGEAAPGDMSGVSDNDVKLKSMSFMHDEYYVKLDDEIALFINMAPANVSRPVFALSSSDSDIADVSFDGLVYGAKEGKATITAASEDGITATCTVHVVKADTAASSVSFADSDITLSKGEAKNLVATVTPINSTDGIYSIESSDEDVAYIENGAVFAKAKGSATITATTASGKTATCKVTVTDAKDVNALTISDASKTAISGSSFSLYAKDADGRDFSKSVEWTSSDSSVAAVSNGKVTCVGEGIALITAKTGSWSASCRVSVKAKSAYGVTLNRTSVSMYPAKMTQLNAYTVPSGLDNAHVTWTSSDESVATVNESGAVTAHKIGKAVITATTDNGKSASCAISVLDAADIPVQSVTIDAKVSVEVGHSVKLAANVSPADAKNKDVTWTSSDSSVATVSGNGTVTGVKAGGAVITATAGGKSANCTVTVTAAKKASFSVSPEMTINTQLFDEMDGEVESPADYVLITDDVLKNEKTIPGFLPYTFASSDESLIKVDEYGGVYPQRAIQPGESDKYAYITVTNTDDGSTQQVKVTLGKVALYEVDDAFADDYAREMLRLVNDAREAEGLDALEYMEGSQDCANARALELADKFAHERPDGSDSAMCAIDYGYTAHTFGRENITASENAFLRDGKYYIYSSPVDAAQHSFKRWMASAGHRANILSADSKYFTTGVACGPTYDKSAFDGYMYTVQEFAIK